MMHSRQRASSAKARPAVAMRLLTPSNVRVLQAAFRDPNSNLSPDDSYSQGCSPCLVLPFEPASSTCEKSISDEPVTYSTAPASTLSSTDRNRIESIFRVKNDFAQFGHCTDVVEGGEFEVGSDCDKMTVCVDPPRGSIEAEVSHAAGITMVNSIVVIRLLDVPVTRERRYWFSYQFQAQVKDTRQPPPRDNQMRERFELHHDDVFVYTDSSGATSVLKMQPEIPLNDKFDDLEDLLQRSAGCVLDIRPAFRLVAEPLWPDEPEDAAEIRRLFGSDALDWWNSAPDEAKAAHSRAHGFIFLEGLATDEERQDESERRDQELREVIDCNYGDEVWCQWTPDQSGYYRVSVEGAWPVKRTRAPRWRDNPLGSPPSCTPPPTPPPTAALPPGEWGDLPPGTPRDLCTLPLQEFRLTNDVQYTEDRDGHCSPSRGTSNRLPLDDWDCLDYGLQRMGITDPQDIGIDVSPMRRQYPAEHEDYPGMYNTWDWPSATILTPPTDNLDLHRYGVSDTVTCPAQDVRVHPCSGGSDSANYTETEPLGIIVYQSRVVTRQDD